LVKAQGDGIEGPRHDMSRVNGDDSSISSSDSSIDWGRDIIEHITNPGKIKDREV
jgi:hypothetical protein